MRLSVEQEMFRLFPGISIVVAIARGIDNRADNPDITEFLTRACHHFANNFSEANAQSHPFIKPWRDGMKRAGVSGKKFPSSIEALARRVLKDGAISSINPLVDLYNAISIKQVVPAGGYDLDEIESDLCLRLTEEGESFHALGTAEPTTVIKGEIAYADANDILTRHFVWRQSEKSKITRDSKNVLLLSEILEEVGEKVTRAVLVDFRQLLEQYFQIAPETFIVTSQNPTITF